MPRSRTSKPRKPKPPPVELLPAGTLICRVDIPHRAVPWKVPRTNRYGGAVKDKSLKTWQKTVALYARVAMGNQEPYAGPVRIRFVFELRRRPGAPPDLTNLIKGTEDPLQGIVIANDRQVCGHINPERIIGEINHTFIECFAN